MNRFLKVCMIKYDYEQINKSEFAEGLVMIHYDIDTTEKYSLQGTTQGRYLTGGVPPVRFSM